MSHYKPYPKYLKTDVAWIGEVPEHWMVCKLNYRFSVELGKMLDQKRITGDHLVRYLRNQDVQWGQISTDDLPLMDITPTEFERYTAIEGDLLVCEGGDVGRAAIWRGGAIGYQKALHRLRPRKRDHAAFMLNVLFAAKARGVFSETDSKATISHLPAEAFRAYRFPFPPPDEQAAITTALDRETARIDALIAKKTRFIELLKEKRQALITHAVTKGLDPTVRMKDSGVEWIGEVPTHWAVPKLRHVATVQTGTAKGKDLRGAESVLVPYLRVANVQDGYLDLTDVAKIEIPLAELGRYLLRPGDVLMNEGGDNDKLGRGHIWQGEIEPCIHQNHVFAVRPHGLSGDWLNAYTGSLAAQAFFAFMAKQTTNLASISSSSLMNLPVPCPPKSEQGSILDYIKKMTARIDLLAIRTDRSIALIKERRAALITAAVTGQIDLRDESRATQDAPR